MRSIETMILNKPVTIEISDTGDGLTVAVYGGDRGHIGAVAIARPGEEPQVIQFPTHKEGIVAQMFAERLCEAAGVSVVVTAGIHYNDFYKEMIPQVISGVEEAIAEVIRYLNEPMCKTM